MGYVHGRQVHVLMNKNLWLLILSQIFAFTAAPVTVFLSGIIGSNLSPTKSLATLPMAVSVVGIALFAFFAAKLHFHSLNSLRKSRFPLRIPKSHNNKNRRIE